jgi:hypothetical protein
LRIIQSITYAKVIPGAAVRLGLRLPWRREKVPMSEKEEPEKEEPEEKEPTPKRWGFSTRSQFQLRKLSRKAGFPRRWFRR